MSQSPVYKNVLPFGVVSTRQRELQGNDAVVSVWNRAVSSEIDVKESGVLQIWTDASWLHKQHHGSDHAGAGIAYHLGGKWHTVAEALLLPRDDSAAQPLADVARDVHEAEMLAFVLAFREVEILDELGVKPKHLQILTDSNAAKTRWDDFCVGDAWTSAALTTGEAKRCWDLRSKRDMTVETIKVFGHSRDRDGNWLADGAAGFAAHKSRAARSNRGRMWEDSTEEEWRAAETAPSEGSAGTMGRSSSAEGEGRTAQKKQQKRKRNEEKREEALTPKERYDRLWR